MARLLHIDSATSGELSVSRGITAAFARSWAEAGGDVTYRDVAAHPIPHLPTAALHWTPAGRRPGAAVDEAAEELQSELIDELLAADVVLLGAPMYNYSLPSQLKAWLDHVHVPGLTTAGGAKSPAGRPIVAVVTAGAVYDEASLAERDHGSPVLRIVLEQALGMPLTVITADATLADHAPTLAAFGERRREQFDDAVATAERLARELV